ncbi:hypothetical protein O7599_17555 [Streptomyces sp. WMMC500]|uniref:hypothetical protein n=1 Tax=Streptomyces sp. WMMC500 TaxID=3015154 RepID=UPI00248BA6C7|nr:hypothetical protein [Streptomyces sp. WMMC500]WBB64202.1 hypothetical protein O7599_17555 [Streptomyces sp. WMMC500]
MAAWEPRTGETLLSRGAAEFATGMAAPVSGKRWFRDTERRDIQHELLGWPEGPTYTVRSRADQSTRRTARGVGVVSHAVVAFAAGALGAVGTPFGAPESRGKSEDPENEVDDFPVVWGQAGAIARTLPWQLDPARRPGNYRSHAIVTDVRLVVVGFPDDDTSRDELLWEADRSVIAQVERKKFSTGQRNFTIAFTDGSWCRLHSYDDDAVNSFLRHLSSDFLPLDQLTPAQRNAIDAYLEMRAGSNRGSGYPYRIVTRRPSGNILFEAWSEPADPIGGNCSDGYTMHLIGPEGEHPTLQPGDLD